MQNFLSSNIQSLLRSMTLAPGTYEEFKKWVAPQLTPEVVKKWEKYAEKFPSNVTILREAAVGADQETAAQAARYLTQGHYGSNVMAWLRNSGSAGGRGGLPPGSEIVGTGSNDKERQQLALFIKNNSKAMTPWPAGLKNALVNYLKGGKPTPEISQAIIRMERISRTKPDGAGEEEMRPDLNQLNKVSQQDALEAVRFFANEQVKYGAWTMLLKDKVYLDKETRTVYRIGLTTTDELRASKAAGELSLGPRFDPSRSMVTKHGVGITAMERLPGPGLLALIELQNGSDPPVMWPEPRIFMSSRVTTGAATTPWP